MNENVPYVPHTEFEGYKAITKNTVNNFPNDVNGLKSAMAPQQFVTPLRANAAAKQLGLSNSAQS